MNDDSLEYPYVDEHEYNCVHILKVEEKPE